jgi:hypothetical protein
MNRFLPVHSERSKKLPNGGSTPKQVVDALSHDLVAAVKRASSTRGDITRDDAAGTLWDTVYDGLTPDVPDGPLASVIARAAPQVLRLSLIYALLDQHDGDVQVRVEHLQAALAAWRYVEASARLTFGDLQSNRDLNKLAAAIDSAGDHGLTRDQVRGLFDRHKKRDELDELLRQLTTTGCYTSITEPTGGRPATRYFAVGKRDKRDKATGANLATEPTDQPLTALTALTALPTAANLPIPMEHPAAPETGVELNAAVDRSVAFEGTHCQTHGAGLAGDDSATTMYGVADETSAMATVGAADIAIPTTVGTDHPLAHRQGDTGFNHAISGNPRCRRCDRDVLYAPKSIERGTCARCADELANAGSPQ